MSSDARATALRLRDDFKMSPSQKDISAQIIKKRLQIVWGPPVSANDKIIQHVTRILMQGHPRDLERLNS